MFLLKILLIFKLIKADCPFKENNQIVQIKNFNNLSELNFNQCKEPISVNNWGLNPSSKIILDNTLNLKGLIFELLNKKADTIFFHLSNFKGFDLLSNPFNEIKFISKTKLIYKIWYIESTTIFDFYLNNKLIQEKDCLNNNNNNNKNWNNLITNSESYFLSINAFFSLKTCPYIFENTSIYMIIFNKIITSFINSNKLTFLTIKNSSLNSRIFFAEFDLYRIQFDGNLFNEAIFKKTVVLQINGILNSIQNDLFKSFNDLKIIRIQTQYVKQIFAKNNKWLEYLSFNFKPIDIDAAENLAKYLKKSIFLIIFQIFPKLTFYDYPNEDFCLFMKFPHNKLVFPLLRPSNPKSKECSCTEFYLIQYSFIIQSRFDYYTNQITSSYQLFLYYLDEIRDSKFSKCIQNEKELNNFILKCNFKQRLNKCAIQNISKKYNKESNYFEMFDWIEVRKISSLIFSVYLNTIVSLISIIFNILTILIVKSKAVLKVKNPIYKFLFINAVLSTIYITIVIFKILGICIDSNFYCSPLIETKFNIYYKVIFVLFIGESIKTAFNLSFISFTLSRYIKVTSTQSSFLLKLDNLKKRYYLLISLVIAVFINLYHIFQYNLNLNGALYSYDSLNSFESFFKDSNPSDEFIEHFTNFQFYLLNFFFYIKVIFSDLFYIIFNLIIDLKLLSFIKTQNSKRSKIVAQVVNNNTNQADSTSNRLTFMIILNGLNCFILRFPSAFANLYGFIFRYDKTDKIFKPNISGYIVCRGFKICSSLQEILYFLFLISLLIQFFIFLKFDKIFHKGYNEIKENILKKFKKPQSLNNLVE
jgi:hypothetical protein